VLNPNHFRQSLLPFGFELMPLQSDTARASRRAICNECCHEKILLDADVQSELQQEFNQAE
jgi:hypothetical protein